MFVLVAGVGAVTLLAPGGLGDPEAQVVADGPSAVLYRAVTGAVSGAPPWLTGPGAHAALGGLLVLALLWARTVWCGWRCRPAALAGPALVGVGAALAYLVSEAVKLVVDEERPCRALPGVVTWVACPPAGDWSFPSNHASVAGALAGGLVLVASRFAVPAVLAAAVVAALRVVTGVHYPHDVLAGLLLGASLTAALWVLVGPGAQRLPPPVPGGRPRLTGGRRPAPPSRRRGPPPPRRPLPRSPRPAPR